MHCLAAGAGLHSTSKILNRISIPITETVCGLVSAVQRQHAMNELQLVQNVLSE